MAWRQSPGGSEQHLTRAAAAARTRTQRPGKHLAVHASELVVKPDFQILRRYRRPLLLRLEQIAGSRRSAAYSNTRLRLESVSESETIKMASGRSRFIVSKVGGPAVSVPRR